MDALTYTAHLLITQSWHLAILILLVGLASFALRNRNAHIRYLLWLIIVAKCLVPPLYTVSLAILPETKPIRIIDSQAGTLPRDEAPVPVLAPPVSSESDEMALPVATPQPAGEFQSPLTLSECTGLAWLVGLVIYMLVILTQAIWGSLWIRRHRSTLPSSLRDRIDQILSGARIKVFPKVWLVEGVSQPFLWGSLRGSIYLPQHLADSYEHKHLRSVLIHEVSHMRRFDAAVNLLQVIAQGIFWFHPLVWWANHRIRVEREKCCDEMTIAALGAPAKDYGKALIDTVVTEYESARPTPSLAIVGPAKSIEERIRSIMKPHKRFYSRPSVVAATIILFLAVLTVPTALVLTAGAQTSATAERVAGRSAESLHEAVGLNNVEEVKRLIAGGADVNAKNERSRAPLNWGVYQSSLSREVAELLIDAGADVKAQDDEGMTPLHGAIYVGMGMDIIRLLVDKGANVNLTTKEGWTPLHYAVDMENLDIVRLLVDKGAAFNVKNQEGWTAFSGAALRGRTDMTELFLAKGVDTSGLHMAAFTGDLSRVRQLVETGTEIDTKDEFGWTALFWAACSGQTKVAEFLIENKADLSAQDGSGRSLLHQAAQAPTDAAKLVELLITKGADVNARNATGDTPLILACYPGNKKVAALLIDKGADVSAKDNMGGRTALHRTARTNHTDVAEVLLSKGADVNAELSTRATCYTPLHLAAMTDANMVRFLLEHGAAINASSGSFGRTPFHQAVIMGNTDIVKLLIDRGVDVNAPDRRPGITPLAWAVRQGHTEIAELLLAKGANVNTPNSTGVTPLDLAEERGNAEIIALLRQHGAEKGSPTLLTAVTSDDIEQAKSLIAKGADVNAATATGLSLLHTAVRAGNAELVEVLLDHGADVNAKAGPYGQTPLHWAAMSGNEEIVDSLIAHGADIKARDGIRGRLGNTACFRAAANGRRRIVELLLEKGADIEEKDGNGLTLLHLVAGSTRVFYPDIIELLLAKGADIEARTYYDDTPLHVAITMGRKEAAELLLSHGAKLNVMSKFWGTPAHQAMSARLPDMVRWSIAKGVDIPPLHQACYFGEEDKVRSLLAGGADVNQRDVAQFTPLHCAMLGQHAEIMQLLVDKGADIEARNCANQTPLYYACSEGYLEMVKLLVSNGADLRTRGDRRGELGHGSADDWTPLHIASYMGHVKVVEYLLAQGADIQATCKRFDDGGFTALHNAAWNGRSDVVKTLLAKGANVNAKTDKGETPASLAEKNEHPEIVSLLLGKPIGTADLAGSAKTRRSAFTDWYGKPAPDFTVTDITGKQHKISEYRGKSLILNFWATWCGPCRREIPDIIELRRTVSEDELAILGISTEKGKSDLVKEFATKERMNYTIIVSEGPLVPPYSEITAIPTTFIIDSKGNIKIATVGTLSLNDLRSLLQAQ